jgi:hypothetical protein
MPGVSPTAWAYFTSNRDPLWDTVTAVVTVFLPVVKR